MISKHFQDNSNLFVLDKAVENSSQLRKIMSAGDTVKESDDFLVSLLLQSTNSEKLHTKHLYENSHTSTKLPNKNEIIHGYVVSVILTKFRINANISFGKVFPF